MIFPMSMRRMLVTPSIGETMRGQPPRSLAMPADVFEKLKRQPTVLAPRRRVLEGRAVRVALAAAASVATVGVVGWIGSQGGAGPAVLPTVAKGGVGTASIEPVASTTTVQPAVPALTVQEYLVAHRQMPSPELYRPVTNRTPAAPAR